MSTAPLADRLKDPAPAQTARPSAEYPDIEIEYVPADRLATWNSTVLLSPTLTVPFLTKFGAVIV